MKMSELEKLMNVVNYVIENEYTHFLECIQDDAHNSDIGKALKDDEFVHIYKDAYYSKSFLRSVVVD